MFNIRKTYYNIYLWFITKAKRDMAAGHNYKQLISSKEMIFNNLKTYIESPQNELLDYIKCTKDANGLLVHVGDYKFLLAGECKAFAGLLYLNTFRIQKNDEFKEVYSRLNDLDIKRYPNDFTQFINPKPAIIGGQTVPITQITDFNKQYVAALISIIKAEEAELS